MKRVVKSSKGSTQQFLNVLEDKMYELEQGDEVESSEDVEYEEDCSCKRSAIRLN